MGLTETPYAHIVLDEAGVPLIAGTTMKVKELVASHQAYGWSPEELAYQYPHLTMGQVHSALAYYWDHYEEIDREIERDLEFVEELRRRTPTPAYVARIKALRARR
jgi:uncharacterized protein (DUF433 family)